MIFIGQSYDAYNAALNLLKEDLPKNKSFGACGYPQAFTADSSAEINALHNSWPKTNIYCAYFMSFRQFGAGYRKIKIVYLTKDRRKHLMKTF